MPRRRNNANNQFVAKPGPRMAPNDERRESEREEADEKQAQNKSRIVVDTPGVQDEPAEREEQDRELADVNRKAEIIRRGGAYSDRIKREPYSQLDKTMKPKQPLERT